MRYNSKIACPLYIDYFDNDLINDYFSFYIGGGHLLDKKFLKKGEVYKGFILPTNYFLDDYESFFSRFGLWENSNGINQIGKVYDCQNIAVQDCFKIYHSEPIMVGDMVNGIIGQVVYAEGRYIDENGFWDMNVYFGELVPLAYDLDYSNDFYKEIISTLEGIKTELSGLKGKAVSEVITTGQATSETTSLAWDSAITTLETNIGNKIIKLKGVQID